MIKFVVGLAGLLAGAPAYAAEGGGPATPHVVCTPGPAIAAPARDGDIVANPQPAICPAGQVPQPIGRIAPKGRPRIDKINGPGLAGDPQSALYYFYAAAFSELSSNKAQGQFTEERPVVSPSDYHSLAELAVESADGTNVIEVGWTVDTALNGDTSPHLFVFHWINGSPTCYNGCGFVQVSSTRYPGMTVGQSAQPQHYAVRFDGSNWWIGYQGEWIGYFPGSLWAGAFEQIAITQWFGEVAASSPQPCTQMGDGLLGTIEGAAAVASEKVGRKTAGAQQGELTNANYYTIGSFTGKSYHFGGPGAC